MTRRTEAQIQRRRGYRREETEGWLSATEDQRRQRMEREMLIKGSVDTGGTQCVLLSCTVQVVVASSYVVILRTEYALYYRDSRIRRTKEPKETYSVICEILRTE